MFVIHCSVAPGEHQAPNVEDLADELERWYPDADVTVSLVGRFGETLRAERRNPTPPPPSQEELAAGVGADPGGYAGPGAPAWNPEPEPEGPVEPLPEEADT